MDGRSRSLVRMPAPSRFFSKGAIDGGRRAMGSFAGIGLSQNANSDDLAAYFMGVENNPFSGSMAPHEGKFIAAKEEEEKLPVVGAIEKLEETVERLSRERERN